MPRDGSGIYHRPVGTDGVTDTTIESTKYNVYVADVEQDLNTPRPIVAGGTGANGAAAALTNLGGEMAKQVVTNYDSMVFQPGSFYSAAGATSAPVAGHAFSGICYVTDASNMVVEARDYADGRNYFRVKQVGVWGQWYVDGRTVAGGAEGIGAVAGDMFYGVQGTAPNSSFIVNTKADVSGTNVFTLLKSGDTAFFTAAPGHSFDVTMNVAPGYGSNLWGYKNSLPRWAMQLGNEAPESGGNAGSNFVINRYNDGGVSIDTSLSINRSTGTAQFSKDLVAAGNIAAGNTGTVGTYYFGNSGTKYLTCDGTNFSMSGGALFVNSGGINAAGSISASSDIISGSGSFRSNAANSSANSHIWFNDEASNPKALVYWLRSANSLVMQNQAASNTLQVLPSGTIQGGAGYRCKSGYSGGYSGSTFNFQWNGASTNYEAWVDSVFVGYLTLSSDYRTKKDVIDLPTMWDTVKALHPIKYTQADFTPPVQQEANAKTRSEHEAAVQTARANGKELPPEPMMPEEPMFPADNIERWGFIAHELQDALIPSAATGVKDSHDTVQSPNPWTVIAALTKALQEAMTRIEALEARA